MNLQDLTNRHWVFVDIQSLCTALDDSPIFDIYHPAWDVKINLEFVEYLKRLGPNAVMIVDNIPFTATSNEEKFFRAQFGWIIACVQEILGIEVWVGGQYSPLDDAVKERHLPETGMLEDIFEDCKKKFSIENSRNPITIENCIYIGSNKNGLKAAETLGIPCAEFQELKEMHLPVYKYKVIDLTTGRVAEGIKDHKKLTCLAEEYAVNRARDLNKRDKLSKYAVVPMHWKASDIFIPKNAKNEK